MRARWSTRCAQAGIKVFGVTKGTCGMPQVARAMLRGGVVGIAESRFENIRRLRDSGIAAPIMLLRSPPIARVEEVVRTVDISLQSELAIIRELSRIAERMGRVHDIMLMVDLGDLREGIWPSDLLPTVEQVLELKGVRIAGIGTNLGCFGAIMPTRGKSRAARRPCLQDRAADRHQPRSGLGRQFVLAAAAARRHAAGRHQQSAGRRGDPAGRASRPFATSRGRRSNSTPAG